MESDVISPEVVLLQCPVLDGRVGQCAGTFWHEMDLETSPLSFQAIHFECSRHMNESLLISGCG